MGCGGSKADDKCAEPQPDVESPPPPILMAEPVAVMPMMQPMVAQPMVGQPMMMQAQMVQTSVFGMPTVQASVAPPPVEAERRGERLGRTLRRSDECRGGW